MAEMNASDRRNGRHPRRGSPRHASIRIDLTPMVDLAFLLITFFMLSTMLAKPQIMPMVMPDNKTLVKDPPALSRRQVLTLLLGAGDKVYWYEDPSNARLDSTNFQPDGLRRVILQKKSEVRALLGDKARPDPRAPGGTRMVSELNILIKPSPGARYKNVVDVFDEMKICGIEHYMMLDISPQEQTFIQNPAAGLHFDVAEQMAAAYRK